MMTENEAIKILKKPTEHIKIYDDNFVFPSDFAKAYETAIKALEEIQQYRALEEKLNGISVEQVVNGFISTVEKQTHEEYKRGRILTNKEADEWNELQAIGTVEELQRAKQMEAVYRQVKWERDIAISQLEEIGISLGQNMDDIKALKEKSVKVICPICGKAGIGHCNYCGQDLKV